MNISDFGMDGDIFSDLYKSIHGFRPRGLQFSSSDEFYQHFYELSKEVEQSISDDEAHMTHNVELFTKRVNDINSYMPLSNVADIIRIIMDTYNANDNEELEFHLDLPYGTIDKMVA